MKTNNNNNNRRRVVLLTKPLQYPVYCGSKCVIPAGATGVSIIFRGSHLTRFDENAGEEVRMNVYLYRGRVYHA